jgi:hypothetical protein
LIKEKLKCAAPMRELEELIKIVSTDSIFLVMLEWIKNKELPEFWKTYLLNSIKKSNRYVVLLLKLQA